MEQTQIEQLLAPRFKVIADYPNNPFSVGQILNLKHHGGFWRYEYYGHDGLYTFSESEFNEYPHLFKRLEWWEERMVEDMPEYVKSENTVWKFIGIKHYEHYHGYKNVNVFLWNGQGHGCVSAETFPATVQEYIAYVARLV